MEPTEAVPVIDVHSPHEPVHGWRDFLLHILTITIGLLIALGLEGLVDWQHHRHLVYEAEASLHGEIQNNERDLSPAIADLHKQEDDLKKDVTILRYIAQNHKLPKDDSMTLSFHIRTYDDVSWRTAQATTAFSYMPYARAEEYAEIYHTQELLETVERQAARDAIISLAPFLNASDKRLPTPAEATDVEQKIAVLQGQLMLVDSLMTNLDKEYKKFLAAHPS